MSVMSAAEAGHTGDAGPNVPVPRPRLRVAGPAAEQDFGDEPESLPGAATDTEPGPAAPDGGPWLAAAQVRSTELRVREVRVVRRASVVTGQADTARASTARASTVEASTVEASTVAARISTATQARAESYARAAGVAGAPGTSAGTRSRVAARSRTVTQTRIVARTQTHTQRPGAIRLTRRGRRVVAGFIMLVVIVVATVIWMTAAGSVQASSRGGASASPYQGMTQVVVRPGQTVWSIAAAAEPSANPWAVVQQITEINALDGATVHAGQLLWVPKA